MNEVLMLLDQDAGVDNRREVVIRGLMVYLSENAEHLITHYQHINGDLDPDDLTHHTLRIVTKGGSADGSPLEAGIVLEGVQVIAGLQSVPNAYVDVCSQSQLSQTTEMDNNIQLNRINLTSIQGQPYANFISWLLHLEDQSLPIDRSNFLQGYTLYVFNLTPDEECSQHVSLVKSGKWYKRWPDIDQPWPMEGTLNADVIKTIQVLVATYKTSEKTGRKGEKRKEKRRVELGILQLFEDEGQKFIKAAKEKRDKGAEEIGNQEKRMEKQMAEISVPFSHVNPVKQPPPYEKEVKFKDLHPQLLVISQGGGYCIRDEDDRIIEAGQAEMTIKMYPSSKSKRRPACLQTEGERESGRRKLMMTTIRLMWWRSWVDMILLSGGYWLKQKKEDT
ncbi:hypothetical protein NFI96_008311, partial [Prochilodus magdalenae]